MKKISILFLVLFCGLLASLNAKSRRALGKSIVDPSKSRNLKQKNNVSPIKKNTPSEEETIISQEQKPPQEKEALQQQTQTIQENKSEDQAEPEDEIFLNFENAELSNFINYVADLKKANILPNKALAGNKISLTIRTPITKDQAWDLLHTIIDMSGFSIVKVGDLYKIVPSNQKLIQPLPTYINVPLETLPDSDINIRYIAMLSNIKVSDVKGLLDSMLGTPHLAIAQENVNGLILSDKSYNIKSAMKIIQELDKTGLKESVVTIQLKERNATDVQAILKTLIEDKQPTHPLAHLLRRQQEQTNSFFPPGTKIIAEERLNKLILMGTEDATRKIANFVREHLDTSLKEMDSPLHVYDLQYVNAKQIVEILKEAIAQPESIAGQEATKFGAVRGNVKYFKPMFLKSDDEGNRIIVSTSEKQDWKLIKKTIKNLDKPQPQVAIETLIVIVNTEDDKEIGGQFRDKKTGTIGGGVNVQTVPVEETIIKSTGSPAQNLSLLGNLIDGLTGGLGQTLLTFGRENNIWGIFRILQKNTHTSVVAQPFLTIANKYEAGVIIGETKRRISETALSASGADVKGFEDAVAHMNLKVTPQINIDGVINLKISLDINEFGATVDEIIDRKLATAVSIANGQVLALGGFVKTKISEVNNKVPILGDIPILGWAFKNKKKTVTKQNILIFMSPTIIKPRSTQGINLYTRMKLEQAKEAVGAATITGKTPDPIHDWFFNPDKKTYSHKVDDYASARYQPVTVDIKNDEYYRAETKRQEIEQQHKEIIKKGMS